MIRDTRLVRLFAAIVFAAAMASSSYATGQATAAIQVSGPSSATTTQQVIFIANVTTISTGVAPTGTVTFSAGSSLLGNVSVVGVASDPNTGSFASATATLPFTFSSTGAQTITAQYSGDINYTPAGPSSPISINITTPSGSSGSVSITATPVTVPAGGSNTSTITLTPGTGFTSGPVEVACEGSGTDMPPGVNCAPAPLTINVPSTGSATGQLTISVLAPSGILSASVYPDPSNRTAIKSGLPMSASLAHFPRLHLRGQSAKTWFLINASLAFGSWFLLLPWPPGIGKRKSLRAAMALTLVCVLGLFLGCGGPIGGGGGGGGAVATHTSVSVNTSKLPASNDNFAFSFTVTSAGNPTGQVQLFDGGIPLGVPVTISNGTAQTNIGLGSVGTHSITAHYLGTSTTLPSISGTLNLTLTGTTTIPLTTTPAGSGGISLTVQ